MKDLPETQSTDPKNYFYLLGQSLDSCQKYEHVIQLLVMTLSAFGVGIKDITFPKVKEIIEGKSSKPLGQLLDILGKMVEIDEDGKKLLGEALKSRNEIIHRFIRENNIENTTEKIIIINKLKTMVIKIDVANDIVIQLIKALCKIKGIDIEKMELKLKNQEEKNAV